jgi:uncharacterized damage-inducible protein DinB
MERLTHRVQSVWAAFALPMRQGQQLPIRTRRVIDAFPDDKLFGFSVGAMRPFGALALDDLILYVIDNEIHHRGQGYVSLRVLGIEPPAFYDRS